MTHPEAAKIDQTMRQLYDAALAYNPQADDKQDLDLPIAVEPLNDEGGLCIRLQQNDEVITEVLFFRAGDQARISQEIGGKPRRLPRRVHRKVASEILDRLLPTDRE